MVDPLADTLRKAIETVGSTVASGGAMQSWIEMVIARRPVWAAQLAAAEFMRQSASTAPLWRWVRVAGPNFVEASRGTSMVATVQGATGLAVTAGIPIVAAIGVWVMLGSGYLAAQKEVRRRGFMSGFSHAFTTGVLNWQWEHTVRVFAKPFVIRKNAFAPSLDRDEAIAYNEGLIKGWAAGNAVPEVFYDKKQDKVVDKKKSYRIAMRKLANVRASGAWSRHPDEARLQQWRYVIELAGAGVKNGLIITE